MPIHQSYLIKFNVYQLIFVSITAVLIYVISSVMLCHQVEVDRDPKQSVSFCDCSESRQPATLCLFVSQSTGASLRGHWARHWREHSAQSHCSSHRFSRCLMHCLGSGVLFFARFHKMQLKRGFVTITFCLFIFILCFLSLSYWYRSWLNGICVYVCLSTWPTNKPNTRSPLLT